MIACGGDAGITRVSQLWQHEAPANVSPAGTGAEGRIIVALSESVASGGRILTLQDFDGGPFEGPFDGVPISDHAPVMTEGRLFMLTKIGGLVAISLAGDTLFMNPPAGAPSPTSPLIAVGDSVRWGTADGFVVSVGIDGMQRFKTPVGDPVTTALAAGSDGRTYATTDTGRVIAIDASGAIAFDQQVDAPASGPTIGSGDVAVIVGEGSGVRALKANGSDAWRHPRAARVVGASLIDGAVMAWGEDGKLERLSITDGTAEFAFATAASNPPPIYVAPVAVDGAFGVLDSTGVAHLVGPDGASLATLGLDAEPAREVLGAKKTMYVSLAKTVRAIRFIYAPAE